MQQETLSAKSVLTGVDLTNYLYGVFLSTFMIETLKPYIQLEILSSPWTLLRCQEVSNLNSWSINCIHILSQSVLLLLCGIIIFYCIWSAADFFPITIFIRTSFEAGQHWNLVVLFCRVHKMEFPLDFLQDCARDDKWLPFVCHAQTCQFPKEQVGGRAWFPLKR